MDAVDQMTLPADNRRTWVGGLGCRELCFVRKLPGRETVTILDGLRADFAFGRIALVAGATGVGKSTLMYLLAGLLRPTSGEVSTDVGVVSRFTAPHRDRWRRRVGIVFQDLQLADDLSVLENILLPVIPRPIPWRVLAETAATILAQTDLHGLGDFPVNRLSGGERQRVAMARAMVGSPRFLFLDEPTAFQDDRHTAALLDLWAGMALTGVCVVICSHDPRVKKADQVHDRWLLKNGRLERPA